MPQLIMPTIGTKLILTKNWTFSLVPESRNFSVWEHFFPNTRPADYQLVPTYNAKGKWNGWKQDWGCSPKPVTLPKGTELRVDRVYIRQKLGEYDSITFQIISWPGKAVGKAAFGRTKLRFWAKLSDVNNIFCNWNQATLPQPII